ncbi:hypothetical protein ACFQV2_31410 [Actinokineospora soli]|uniref:UDP-N-acetylglucosamine:LPS N-acetylglucosamine transferase n=1 Tax=Actinokineospora soli TaxID=1048753 RepID=A0ABW2TWR6_9PSEU
MDTARWIRGPVGHGATGRLTRVGLKTVLVLVQTVTAANRLADVLPVIDGDHRVQPVYAVPHGADAWHGVESHVRSLGGLVLPWEQAIREKWDLVVSTCREGIEQVHGNLLMLPHGAGAGKSRLRSRMSTATEPTTGLDREVLVRSGRIIPTRIALHTDADLRLIAGRCPEARSRAFIAGDPCLDRMLASRPLRERYRAAMGASPGQDLVLLTSTWSPESAFGRHPDLPARLVDEFPAARVGLVLHPNVWAVHGASAIRGWLSRALTRGLVVVPPERGWQGAVLAADVVVGDHGSTTAYALAVGARVALAAAPVDNLRRGSVSDQVRRMATTLDHGSPLAPQLARAAAVPAFAGVLSSRIGEAHARLREAVYQPLGLPEPDWAATPGCVPVPAVLPW